MVNGCIVHLLSFSAIAADRPSVLTIGNFDGVHLGHQQLIRAVQAEANALSAVSCVVLFEPQPMEFFCPHCAPARLLPLRDKIKQLRALGVNRVAIVRFDQAFSQVSANDFVQHLLLTRLQAKAIWIGDDFRFGVGRQGDFALMQRLCAKHQVRVSQTASLLMNERRVSSTWIREALAADDMRLAKQLLGRDYAITGRVVHGRKLGRTLGFPTMNLRLTRTLAMSGVFAVQVRGLSDLPLLGVANLGVKPTLKDTASQQSLEVHLFDWQDAAYGRLIEVTLCHRIRSEQSFDSLSALTAQIAQDKQDALIWHQAALASS